MLAVLGGGPLAKLKVSRSLSVYWLKGSSGRCANCLHSSLHWCRMLSEAKLHDLSHSPSSYASSSLCAQP